MGFKLTTKLPGSTKSRWSLVRSSSILMAFLSGHGVRPPIAVRSAVLVGTKDLQFGVIRAAIPEAPKRVVSYPNVLVESPEYPLVTLQISIICIIFILIHTLVLHIVFEKTIHLCFVERSTNNSLMQIRRQIERMPHDINSCATPFDNQNHAINQMSGCSGVNYWHKRREINDNEIKAFP